MTCVAQYGRSGRVERYSGASPDQTLVLDIKYFNATFVRRGDYMDGLRTWFAHA